MNSPSHEGKRKFPMQVLVLGLCRTGTTSIKTALKRLGFHDVYHIVDTWQKDHSAFWVAAMEAKWDGRGSVSEIQWDDVLADYDALSDIPAVMFAEELVQAYPEAKVILTTRSVDSWYNSMMRTVCNPRYYSRLFRLACRFDKRERDSLKMSDKYREICWHNDFERHGKAFFEQHNDSIRKLVPPERLLEFEARQGWGPLCSFLSKEVPEVPYPSANDSASYYDGQEEYVWLVYRKFFEKVAFSSVTGIALGIMTWKMAPMLRSRKL